MEGMIISLSIGKPKTLQHQEEPFQSGIGKTVVKEARLLREGFIGDDVANHKYHGGADRAVCLYCYEHYQKWEEEFNTKLVPPAFGENICVQGALEKDIYIGDIFSLGDAIIQVTQGREPCSTISRFNGVKGILPRLIQTGYTGCFFRVIEEGVVSANSPLKLLNRNQEAVSVLRATQVMFFGRKNKQELETVLNVNELAADWKNKFTKAYAKINA
ncbi:MOSC domain-containing protein [Bacillaceae bacterium Marseille-Q3522]|nr:MOSC domain-containing protein [Bacillaceae bacterium Marseille-Q3522]